MSSPSKVRESKRGQQEQCLAPMWRVDHSAIWRWSPSSQPYKFGKLTPSTDSAINLAFCSDWMHQSVALPIDNYMIAKGYVEQVTWESWCTLRSLGCPCAHRWGRGPSCRQPQIPSVIGGHWPRRLYCSGIIAQIHLQPWATTRWWFFLAYIEDYADFVRFSEETIAHIAIVAIKQS
jgi:hypothetical protein